MKSLLILLLILLSFPTLAGETIYSYISNRCHSSIHGMNGSRFKKTMRETIKASFLDSASLVNIFEQKGFSSNVQMLLSSEEYYQALDDCFGSDSVKKNIFTGSLIAEDITARSAGVLYAAGVYYVGGQLLLSLLTHYPTVGKILLVSGIGGKIGHALYILREHYREATPEEKKNLEMFLKQNSNRDQVVINQATRVVEKEIAEIDSLLAIREESSLIEKRQKLVTALILLRS